MKRNEISRSFSGLLDFASLSIRVVRFFKNEKSKSGFTFLFLSYLLSYCLSGKYAKKLLHDIVKKQNILSKYRKNGQKCPFADSQSGCFLKSAFSPLSQRRWETARCTASGRGSSGNVIMFFPPCFHSSRRSSASSTKSRTGISP